MNIDGWRYYNHAALPDSAPDKAVNMKPIIDGSVWKIHKKVLLARWTSDFDCKAEKKWWYVIKDTPFDISTLKSKRRYEINKGKKNFCIKEINPIEYKEDIYVIQTDAYIDYPEKYRPVINKSSVYEDLKQLKYYKFYGAFSHDNQLCGYAWLNRDGNYIYYAVHKVLRNCEKKGINAAIVAFILEDHNHDLESGCYICDGARNISHETGFQNYLEKYFGFRKAYCELHLKYRCPINIIVKVLYPFRKFMQKFDNNSFIHNINGIMNMEEIIRQ